MPLFLFLAWIVINGRITLEVCLLGVVIASAVYWFMCKFMEYSGSTDRKILINGIRGIQYIVELVWQVILANVMVIKLVLSPKIDIQPALVFFKTDLKSNLARVTLANSITLTPGTITVFLEQNVYGVHCLDKDMADGIGESSFVQMLRKIEAAAAPDETCKLVGTRKA